MFIELKKILNQRIARLGNKEKIELGVIDKVWHECLEKLIEEEKASPILLTEFNSSKPIKLKNGVLTIEVKSQALASEISLLGYELMDRLNKSIERKAIKRLFFKISR